MKEIMGHFRKFRFLPLLLLYPQAIVKHYENPGPKVSKSSYMWNKLKTFIQPPTNVFFIRIKGILYNLAQCQPPELIIVVCKLVIHSPQTIPNKHLAFILLEKKKDSPKTVALSRAKHKFSNIIFVIMLTYFIIESRKISFQGKKLGLHPT